MNLWGLVPLPATALLFGAAVTAVHRKGAPAGRTSFAMLALAMASPMGYLAAVQWQPEAALTGLLRVAASLGLLAFPALVFVLAFRWGRMDGGLGRFGAPLVLVAAATSLVLFGAGAFGVGAARIDLLGEVAAVGTHNPAARALLGELLLTGGAGVVLFQSLRQSTLRAAKPRLRLAATGFLLTSLVIFLVTGQALLYGSAALHVLSLATLGALPAALAPIPALLARGKDDLALSDRARCGISSGVLMGLGAFLIVLAVVGEIIDRIAPTGRLLWFRWGGTILVGGFATLWFVPGLRERVRDWFRVPVGPGRYDWDWRPLLAPPDQRPGSEQLLAALAILFEESLGRTATALWILRDDPPGYESWFSREVPLPFLRHDNSLLRLFRPWTPVVDFRKPPASLARVVAYVDNIELVERQGFRLFVALSSGSGIFGVLAFAPREPQGDESGVAVLDLSAGPLAAVVWGALLAATPEGLSVSGESWLQAAALLHRTAEEARTALPDHLVGERLAAWAASCAETCTERAGLAVGRVSQGPRRTGVGTGDRPGVRP